MCVLHRQRNSVGVLLLLSKYFASKKTSTVFSFLIITPPQSSHSNLFCFILSQRSQSGSNELVDPGLPEHDEGRPHDGRMIRWLYWPAADGADRQGPCYWPDLSTIPRVSSTLPASPLPVCLRGGGRVRAVPVFVYTGGWRDCHVIILTPPPATHINGALQTAVNVCVI